MRRRPLGKTGRMVSELCVGTWGLSGDGYGPLPEGEAERVIDRALELEIRLFDTADVYGEGAMEKLLGARLAGKDALVVTKLGTARAATHPQKRFDLSHLRPAFERSRERLARDTIDVVLLHNPSPEALRRSEAVDFLRELKTLGALGAWGVSAGNAAVARAAMDAGADVIEVAHNALAHELVDGLAEPIRASGVALLARSVLAHGLLAGGWSTPKTFPEGDHRRDRWTTAEIALRISQVDTLKPMVADPVPSLRALALRFVLSSRLVSSMVIGPRTVAQLEDLVRDADAGPSYLRDTQLAELRARLRGVGVRP